MTLSVEELLPLSIRRRFIIGERIIKPNRRLNVFERFWYNSLGFNRFDAIDNITNALRPPLVCIIIVGSIINYYNNRSQLKRYQNKQTS